MSVASRKNLIKQTRTLMIGSEALLVTVLLSFVFVASSGISMNIQAIIGVCIIVGTVAFDMICMAFLEKEPAMKGSISVYLLVGRM